MNNDNLSATPNDRLNRVIDLLLTENALLKQIVTALLPNGKGISEAEMAFVKSFIDSSGNGNAHHLPQTGNNEINISSLQPIAGNFETEISNHRIMNGNNKTVTSDLQVLKGNNEIKSSNQKVQSGNNEMNVSTLHLHQGNYEQQLIVVQENIRPLMKTANHASLLTTSRILIQLALNPATPLHDLRKLTGLSEDGMSKRIMAMKKAGLIVKLSAPKRFLLTEKAKVLFIKIWR